MCPQPYPQLEFNRLSQEIAEKIAKDTGLLGMIIDDADVYADYSDNVDRMAKNLKGAFSDYVEKWPENDHERQILESFNRIDWYRIVTDNFDSYDFLIDKDMCFNNPAATRY